jgi:chorismate mutase / prephenate dehydratase
MDTKSPNLDDIRKEIDQIDRELFDGLRRRFSLIGDVARAKAEAGNGDGSAMRPGREAEIIRGLAEQNDPLTPLAVTARLWREIVNTATRMQSFLEISVCAPDKSVGYWDIARNHFGAATAMSLHRSPSVVLGRVIDKRGMVGLMPMPMEGEENPWWVSLAGAGGRVSPKIIWRLPFYSPGNGQFEDLRAFAIAALELEETGDDITVIMVESDHAGSRGRTLDILNTHKVHARIMGAEENQNADIRRLMIELDGFRQKEDPLFIELAEKLGSGFRRLEILGAYPRPLSKSEGGVDNHG